MFKAIKRWLRREKKVYKVVRQGRTKRSCLAEGEALAIYIQGTWTRPPDWLAEKGYWLTCFETLSAAKAFRSGNGYIGSGYQIWECSAKGIKRHLPPICEIGPLERGELATIGEWPWPNGTLMAKEIKLTTLVAWFPETM